MRKLQEQIKPNSKQPSAESRMAALEAQLMVNSEPEEGDVMKKRGRLPKSQHGGE